MLNYTRKDETDTGEIARLTAISFIAGSVLILVLRTVLQLTGNTAYVLLFNFDYIPMVGSLQSIAFAGYAFHYITCFFSVIILYYILKQFSLQRSFWPYIVVYTIGGGALFFLTALSPQPPAADDTFAWFYWTAAHGIYGYVVAWLIRKAVRKSVRVSSAVT